jgi:integral membrane sensor domain MASE1
MATSRLFVLTGLAVLYYLTGKLGLLLAFSHPSVTAIWPPTGIALASVLLLGYWAWPGIFLGAFLVNATTAGSVATSLGIAVGNTHEALVGVFLIHRFIRGGRIFERSHDVLRFAFFVRSSARR